MATILIVDDGADNRQLLTAYLQRSNHRLLEAADGEEALEVVRRERPDLVLADILMPRMDGYELARRLHTDPTLARTRVVFHTGAYPEPEARALANACGVTHIVAKPLKRMEVLDVVAAVLAEPAVARTALDERFDRAHAKLASDKLVEKVHALEQLAGKLEQRVEDRTVELAAANTKLRDLDRLKDEFLAVVSHDLRIPLTVIMLTADMLQEENGTLSAEKRSECVGSIIQSGGYLTALVNDLLNLAKLEAGEVRLLVENLRAGDVVRRCVEGLRLHAATKRIDVALTVASDDPVVRVDRTKFVEIVNNLLSNAIKFTPLGGNVAVSVAAVPEGVRIDFTDNGPGIPPEDLPLIFQRFKQGRTHATGGEASTGLGLAIVRQLTELHGGRAEVRSTVGVGSTFSVCLPTAAAVARGAQRRAGHEVGR